MLCYVFSRNIRAKMDLLTYFHNLDPRNSKKLKYHFFTPKEVFFHHDKYMQLFEIF